MTTILLPASQATPDLAESILASIHRAAADLGVVVCGGHTEITLGIDPPIVIGQMLGETTRETPVHSSGLEPGHDLILSKDLSIEANAIIVSEKCTELLARGLYTKFLDICANFLHAPGISVVCDARLH